MVFCHAPPLEQAKKQGEMTLHILSPIPFKNVELRDGIGLRLSNGISHSFFAFSRGGA